MIEIIHNTHRKSDGGPMTQPKQQVASFIKYLGTALKPVSVKEISPLAESGNGHRIPSVYGGWIHLNLHNSKTNEWRISWKFQAGRGGVATGNQDVCRAATVRIADGIDPVDYLQNILDNPQSLWLTPVG